MASVPVALLRCIDGSHLRDSSLRALESGSLSEMLDVAHLYESCGYMVDSLPYNSWIGWENYDPHYPLSILAASPGRSVSRPNLPDVSHPFCTASRAMLYFGKDFVAVRHSVNWKYIDEHVEWLPMILAEFRKYAELLGAVEGYVLSYCSPPTEEIGYGDTFSELMQAPFSSLVTQESRGRIRSIDDLPVAMRKETLYHLDYWKLL